jgi:hypothetical protein
MAFQVSLCILLFGALSGQAVLQAQGRQDIRRPTVITEPGSYTLERSFRLPSADTAIEIQSDNVSLDLNGHTINGPGNKGGVGISIMGATGVRVHNGSLEGFGIGVQIMDSNNVRVHDLQIMGQDLGGSPPAVEIGTLIVNSRAVVVKDNLISRVFLGVFVRGGGSGGNRIAHNTLTGGANGALAICYNPTPGAVVGPSGDLVYNNLISRFGTGIATSIQSIGNIFRENDIAYFGQAISEEEPGSNVFEANNSIMIMP